MSGVSLKKVSSGCPFKLTYVKQHNEGFYRIATNKNDTFMMHNHSLPVEDLLPGTAIKAAVPGKLLTEEDEIQKE